MDISEMKFGVSPAFFISMYGKQFGIEDICEALPVIAELGYHSFQPEIVFVEKLDKWLGDGPRIIQTTAKENGLTVDPFIAHFMENYFDNADVLKSNDGIEQGKPLADIAGVLGTKEIILPLKNFDRRGLPESAWNDCKKRLVEKLGTIIEPIGKAGLLVGMEILPGSLVESLDEFLLLQEQIGSERVGLNLDTGHAWAMGEQLAALPQKLVQRIFSTHLCDNNGRENLSLRPGEGTVPWEPLMARLLEFGHRGSFDLEIFCPAEDIRREYSAGREFIRDLAGRVRG